MIIPEVLLNKIVCRETQAENSAKGMTTTIGIASVYIMHATNIHSKNDLHAELSHILKNVFIHKPVGNITTTTKAYIHL